MDITFMLGNGFDISLGLRTKYSDFYEYIKDDFYKNGNMQNEILGNIKENIELWSDLELGLGDYTKHIGSDESKLNKFYDDKFDLDIKLRDYLKREQDRIDWRDNSNIDKVRRIFFNSIYKFYDFLKPTEKDEIIKIIKDRSLSYNLISFNYTNIIENCKKIIPSNVIKSFYIHGSLENENAILGVNDSEQINNEYFKESNEMLIAMCKLEINKFLGEYKKEQLETILYNSEIVCIFGMSIGDTDKYWWNKIVTNLSKGLIKMVIIFHYEPNLDKRNNVRVLKTQEKVKEQLLKYLINEEEIKANLKSKIKVVCNSNIFRLNLNLKTDNELEKLIKVLT